MANFAYVLGSRSTREALVVDPAWDVQGLLDVAGEDGMEIVGALVTHYHQDHVGGEIFGQTIEGLARLLETAPVEIHVNRREAEGLRSITGVSSSDLVAHDGGDAISLGEIRVRLLHTPGHTPGSQCSWSKRPPARAGWSRATPCSSGAAAAWISRVPTPRPCTTA